MKRTGDLYERVITFDALCAAAYRGSRLKKKKSSVARFLLDLEHEVLELQQELINGTYRPGQFRTFLIRDPKERLICAAPFRDRVLHHAIVAVIETLFERRFIFDTYACRKNKGSHRALERAQNFCRRFAWFLKCDIRKFYQSIDHEVLKGLLRRIIKDKRLLELLDLIIDYPPPDCQPGKGLPIGNLTSQHCANLYLDPLDHLVKDELGIKGYVRYMDDFILFDNDKAKLKAGHEKVAGFLDRVLSVEIKERTTILAPTWQGLPFLGFRVYPRTIRIRKVNLKRFVRNVRKREDEYMQGTITGDRLCQSMASMVAHYGHGNTVRLRQRIFGVSMIEV